MHACRHGASGLQTHQASLPVIVEHAEGSGFDFLSPPGCAALRPLIYARDRDAPADAADGGQL